MTCIQLLQLGPHTALPTCLLTTPLDKSVNTSRACVRTPDPDAGRAPVDTVERDTFVVMFTWLCIVYFLINATASR
jgi:hypothetical protein